MTKSCSKLLRSARFPSSLSLFALPIPRPFIWYHRTSHFIDSFDVYMPFFSSSLPLSSLWNISYIVDKLLCFAVAFAMLMLNVNGKIWKFVQIDERERERGRISRKLNLIFEACCCVIRRRRPNGKLVRARKLCINIVNWKQTFHRVGVVHSRRPQNTLHHISLSLARQSTKSKWTAFDLSQAAYTVL